MKFIFNRKHIILFILLYLIVVMIAFDESVASEFYVYFVGKEGKELDKIDIYSEFISPVLKPLFGINEYHFSPNGQYILVSGGSKVYIVDRQTEKVKFFDLFIKGKVCSSAGWSPKSKQFFYLVSNLSGGDKTLYLANIDGEKRIVHKGDIGWSRIFFSPDGDKFYFFEHYIVENPKDPLDNLKVRFLRVNTSDNLDKAILEENIGWEDVGPQDEVIKRLGVEKFNKKKFFSIHPGYWSNRSFSEKGGTIWVKGDSVLYKDPEGKVSKKLFVLPKQKGMVLNCDIRWLPDDRYALISFSKKIFIFDRTSLQTRKIADGEGCGWYEEK